MKNLKTNLRNDLILNSLIDNASFGLDYYLRYIRGSTKINKKKLIKMLACGIKLSNIISDYDLKNKQFEYYFRELIANIENNEFSSEIGNEELTSIKTNLFKVSMPFMIHAIESLRIVSNRGVL